MKRQSCRVLAIVVSALVPGLPASATAQAPSQETSMQDMMERMKEAAEGGARHEALSAFVGRWDVEIAMVMPGAPPQRSKATAQYGWIIDGRWPRSGSPAR